MAKATSVWNKLGRLTSTAKITTQAASIAAAGTNQPGRAKRSAQSCFVSSSQYHLFHRVPYHDCEPIYGHFFCQTLSIPLFGHSLLLKLLTLLTVSHSLANSLRHSHDWAFVPCSKRQYIRKEYSLCHPSFHPSRFSRSHPAFAPAPAMPGTAGRALLLRFFPAFVLSRHAVAFMILRSSTALCSGFNLLRAFSTCILSAMAFAHLQQLFPGFYILQINEFALALFLPPAITDYIEGYHFHKSGDILRLGIAPPAVDQGSYKGFLGDIFSSSRF